jgi:Effector-associated domain 2
VLVVVPPTADTTVLLTSLVDRFRAAVREHNEVSTEAAQMRLRVAVHIGFVRPDAEGVVGSAVNLAFRLLNAEQLKQVLRWTGADLALIASDRVYDDVIRHGLGLVNPSEYQRIIARVKETTQPAWIRVPGMPAPPAPRTLVDTQLIRPAQPTAPDPPAIANHASDLEAVVDLALEIRPLKVGHMRDQIIAALPLALASMIKTQRDHDDRADMSAIVRVCRGNPHGLDDLLGVVRQFAGESTQLDNLRKSIDALGQA